MRKYCWKNGADRLAQYMVATNIQFVKKKKMQYLQSAIKQSTIKRSMPGFVP